VYLPTGGNRRRGTGDKSVGPKAFQHPSTWTQSEVAVGTSRREDFGRPSMGTESPRRSQLNLSCKDCSLAQQASVRERNPRNSQ
jgi:hypothetical protein